MVRFAKQQQLATETETPKTTQRNSENYYEIFCFMEKKNIQQKSDFKQSWILMINNQPTSTIIIIIIKMTLMRLKEDETIRDFTYPAG